jgi:hypothetical protein
MTNVSMEVLRNGKDGNYISKSVGYFGHTLYNTEVAPAFGMALILCFLASMYSSIGCMCS